MVFDGRVRTDDVLVDLGCGRGRVLAYWARSFPDHRCVGIELDAALAASTQRRLGRRPNCTVIAGDAVDALPSDASLLFLFNPFGAPDVERLRTALEQRPQRKPPLRILYSNPRHLEGFEVSDRWTVEIVSLGGGSTVPYHDLAVIDRTPDDHQ